MTTRQPRFAKSMAQAAPMPVPEPVTMTTELFACMFRSHSLFLYHTLPRCRMSCRRGFADNLPRSNQHVANSSWQSAIAVRAQGAGGVAGKRNGVRTRSGAYLRA